MPAVVDASVFGRVILRQGAPDIVDRLAAFIASTALVQPAHWPLEMTGITVRAAHDKKFSSNDREQMRQQLQELVGAANVDMIVPAAAIFDVVLRYGVSAYDAPYLELARRRALPLLTLDEGLRKSATQAGVRLIQIP